MTPNPYILPGIVVKKVAPEVKIQEYFEKKGYSIELLRSRVRTQEVSLIRFIAMWNIRRHCGWKLVAVGNFFLRDHATVLHSFHKLEEWQKYDPAFAKIIRMHNENIEGLM